MLYPVERPYSIWTLCSPTLWIITTTTIGQYTLQITFRKLLYSGKFSRELSRVALFCEFCESLNFSHFLLGNGGKVVLVCIVWTKWLKEKKFASFRLHSKIWGYTFCLEMGGQASGVHTPPEWLVLITEKVIEADKIFVPTAIAPSQLQQRTMVQLPGMYELCKPNVAVNVWIKS